MKLDQFFKEISPDRQRPQPELAECDTSTPSSVALGKGERRSRVINRDYVKRWALDYARTNRGTHPFNRVSESFLNMIEAATKAAIRDRIDRHPSRGKTLM
jgi:hypothetical protein